MIRLFRDVLHQVCCQLCFRLAVVPLVEVMHAVLVNGVSLLLVRTGWRYHGHKKSRHIVSSIFVFSFAFVNVRRQGLQECRAFALLFLVVIDVNFATAKNSIYIYTVVAIFVVPLFSFFCKFDATIFQSKFFLLSNSPFDSAAADSKVFRHVIHCHRTIQIAGVKCIQ